MKGKTLSETQRKILDVGKKEFLAHGFKDASLRGIVKEAGFTQGAFYGYYKSKEELFEALAAPADELVAQFKDAQKAHFDLIPAQKTASSFQLSTDYLFQFLDFMYAHFDAFKLVLCCSAGTRFENYVSDFVDLHIKGSTKYFAQLRKLGKIESKVSPQFYRLIMSAYFTAVFETVVQDMPYKRARSYVEDLATFFNSGWEKLLTIS